MDFDVLVAVVLLALVVFRLTRLIVVDKIGEPARRWLYANQARAKVGPWAFSLISCGYCVSAWLSLAATGWWVWLIAPTWPGIGTFLVVWWAVAGLAALFVSVDMRLIRHE